MERRQHGRRQIPSPARPSVEDDTLAKKESEAFRRKKRSGQGNRKNENHDRKQQVRDLAHFAIKARHHCGFSIINCRPFFLGLASINA